MIKQINQEKIKVIIRYTFFWSLPIVLSFFYEFYSSGLNTDRIRNVIENTLFAVAMLITIPWFKSGKFQRFLVLFYYVAFLLFLFLETSFFKLFSAKLSASVIFILLETNLAEAKEFLQFYFGATIALYFICLIFFGFGFIKIERKMFNQVLIGNKLKLISTTIFFSILAFLNYTDLKQFNFLYLIFKASSDYQLEQQNIISFDIDKKEGNFTKVKHLSKEKKAIYVLVLGESTTRNHLGVYGHYRETTPNLMAMKEDLSIFNDVISPHAFSIGSLKKVLTLNNFKETSESSIIQLMNQAGFKTFWLSNQRPIGLSESLITKTSKAADVYQYTNTAITGSITPYDEVLFPYLEKALNDPSDKKFIVLHILGTHLRYKNRYPIEFNKFIEKPKSKFNSDLALSRRNNYDNAVLYNDFFVANVIKNVKSKLEESYVIYFSDHGEELHGVRDFAGHLDDNPTKSMFEIPFILWRSEKFIENNELILETNRPYVLDDFIHSLSDLSKIEFDELDLQKSIFSKHFKPKVRVIGNGIDYDNYDWKSNEK
jgi:heptose-I-phosphate ethanolaminephosphotransferase